MHLTIRVTYHILCGLIQAFAQVELERFFHGGVCPPGWKAGEKALARKLDMLEAAVALGDLRSPPGNRLEALKGDRAGFYSIRVNDRWRLCFSWTDFGPDQLEMVDYH